MRHKLGAIAACTFALGATAPAADAVTANATPEPIPTTSLSHPFSPGVTTARHSTSTGTNATVGSKPSASGSPMIPYPPPGAFGFGTRGIAEFVSPPVTIGGSTVTTQIANFSGSDIEFGLAYRVQYWDGARWVKADIAPHVFPLIEEQLGSGQVSSPQRVSLPANLLSGLYRVTTTVMREDARGTGQSKPTKIRGYFDVTAVDTPQHVH